VRSGQQKPNIDRFSRFYRTNTPTSIAQSSMELVRTKKRNGHHFQQLNQLSWNNLPKDFRSDNMSREDSFANWRRGPGRWRRLWERQYKRRLLYKWTYLLSYLFIYRPKAFSQPTVNRAQNLFFSFQPQFPEVNALCFLSVYTNETEWSHGCSIQTY